MLISLGLCDIYHALKLEHWEMTHACSKLVGALVTPLRNVTNIHLVYCSSLE